MKRKKKPPEKDDYFFDEGDSQLLEGTHAEEAYDFRSGVLLPTCAVAKALPWPDDVPVLRAEDIAPHPKDKDGKRQAIWIWFRNTFPAGEPEWDLMREIVMDQWGTATARNGFGRSMMDVSEHCRPAEVARLWNNTLRLLGYDISEEEEPDENPVERPRKKRRGVQRDREEA